MQKITCSSCFKSISYEVEKPSFCSKCGKSLNAGFEVKANISTSTHYEKSNRDVELPQKKYTQSNRHTHKRQVVNDEIEVDEDGNEIIEDDNFEIPYVPSLEVNIIPLKRQTLGNLIQNPDNCDIGLDKGPDKLTNIPS